MSSQQILSRFIPVFTLAVYLIIASFGAFSGGVWGVAGIAGALILFGTAWVLDRKLPRPDPCLTGTAFLTLTVMGLLNLNSSYPDISWFDWRRLAGVFLPLMLLSTPSIVARADHRHLIRLTLIATLLGCLALSLELYLGGPLLKMLKGPAAGLTEYNRGLSYLIILAFPLMAGLWVANRKLWIIPFIAILLMPAGLTESRAAKLALMVGLGMTLTAAFRPKLARQGLMVLFLLLMAWPFATQEIFQNHEDWVRRLPDSWANRVEIWDYMAYRIEDKPLLGWGLGTSRKLDFQKPHGERYLWLRGVPAPHPHNVITQLWVELGLPGLALGAIFVLLTLQKIGSLPPRLIPFATGAWAAALCLSLVAYNFWTDSLFSAFALSGFLFSLLKSREMTNPACVPANYN